VALAAPLSQLKKQRYRHSRENGNPSGVDSFSRVFWIPVFTGMTVVVVYRSNLQKIVSHATVRHYASFGTSLERSGACSATDAFCHLINQRLLSNITLKGCIQF
jgi:hypothetical protein